MSGHSSRSNAVLRSTHLLFILLILPGSRSLRAQDQRTLIRPRDLRRGDLVKLVMNDSSHFYGLVAGKPLPDRMIFQTRYGKLETPYDDIAYIMDYRFNQSMKNDLRKAVESNSKDIEKYHLAELIANRKSETPSTIYTESHDAFRGYTFIIGDTKHVILSTDWGEIYLPAKEISDKELFSDFDKQEPDPIRIVRIPTVPPKDPMASQGFVTPNGIAFGKGSFFFSDYLLGGVQFNYGPFDWLSANLGGVFLPLGNSITVATGGLKFTPYSSEKWHVSAGVQGMYSQVIKTTHLALGYGALTYGSWESQLTLFAGYTVNHTDSLGYTNTKNDELLIIQGMKQVGVNFKLGVELFFISNFEIVPLLATLRYFTDRYTIDVGAVLSLYKAGAVRTTKTLAEYVFDTADVPVIPVFSFSYHF